MIRVWNLQKDNYLKEIHKGISNQEIAVLMNNKFHTHFTASAINSRKKVLHLISNDKYKSKYTKEIKEYVKQNHKGKSTIELAKEVSDKFGIECDNNSIQNLKSRIKKEEGFIFEPARNDGHIPKGNIPKNKGKKWDEYLTKEQQEKSRKTTFKKGHKSKNAVAVGEEHYRFSGSKKNDPGYLYVKVADGRGNKNWKPKQVYIYEQHYGPVPEKHKVIFADGDRSNFDIDNLILISEAENLIMNRKKLRYDSKELTKAGVAIAKIEDKVNKNKK